MIEIVDIPLENIIPSVEQVLSAQGIPELKSFDERSLKMAQRAIIDFETFSEPIGITATITNGDFEEIYRGEGNNEPDTPLELIYPDAFDINLFAITLGVGITAGIEMYFERNEFAPGSMLDAAASEGAELAADFLESFYRQKLMKRHKNLGSTGVMRFSPGYCGWHVSGQKRLFEVLQPDKIGLELTDSYLMKPLKSISGAIVAGSLRIFDFEDNFSFCANCRDHSCLKRIELLKSIA
jgi:hypothetical protein